MKISMIGPVTPYRGGIAHFTTSLAKKLNQRGHQVQVISFKNQYPNWLYPGESDKDFSQDRDTVEATYLLAPINPLSWWKTTRAITSFNPDIILLPWWVTFWGPAFFYIITRLKRKGFPITFLIHNTMPHEERGFDRIIVRQTLQKANRFIVMTEKEKQRLLSVIPKTDQIQTTALPIDRSFKSTGLPKPVIKRNLGLPENIPILLFFGFIRPYKGLGELIKALKILSEQGSDAHLLIVGEFWEKKDSYLSLIQNLGLEKQIHIYDTYIPDNEIAAFFEVSDVFVAPYIEGTQSAALKTALGFGLPVVATDVINDDMIKVLQDHVKIVPAKNISMLASGINEQLQKPALTKQLIDDLVNQSWDAMLAAVCKNH